jgi:hypothetical protein
MTQEMKKGFLDFLRVIAIAVVSYFLTEGVLEAVLEYTIGVRISPEMTILITGLLTSALKGIDRWLHEEGKVEGDEFKMKGLTRF